MASLNDERPRVVDVRDIDSNRRQLRYLLPNGRIHPVTIRPSDDNNAMRANIADALHTDARALMRRGGLQLERNRPVD